MRKNKRGKTEKSLGGVPWEVKGGGGLGQQKKNPNKRERENKALSKKGNKGVRLWQIQGCEQRGGPNPREKKIPKTSEGWSEGNANSVNRVTSRRKRGEPRTRLV